MDSLDLKRYEWRDQQQWYEWRDQWMTVTWVKRSMTVTWVQTSMAMSTDWYIYGRDDAWCWWCRKSWANCKSTTSTEHWSWNMVPWRSWQPQDCFAFSLPPECRFRCLQIPEKQKHWVIRSCYTRCRSRRWLSGRAWTSRHASVRGCGSKSYWVLLLGPRATGVLRPA